MLAIVINQGQYAIIGTVVAGVFAILGGLISVRRNAKDTKSVVAEIKVSVDGRLERALQQNDAYAAIIAKLTGTDVPPAVAGLNRPTSPEDTVIADAAEKAQAILNEAAQRAKDLLAAAHVQPLTATSPTTRDHQGVEVPIVEAPVIVVTTPKEEK